MLTFSKLRYKNFLSSGNTMTEIDFLSAEKTLIIGENGAGKSTINDALSFVLFNKPHRNINKPHLINSVNKKECLVELEFSVASQNYMIRRGIKPNVFEIYHNGEMVNQDSHAKEYQKFLETNILKLNHKSFHQVVVLGSSSFVPFMQLPTSQRREVIEDLLDISVFSRMNVLVKEKISATKTEIQNFEYETNIAANNIENAETNIQTLESVNNDLVADIRKELNEEEDKAEELKAKKGSVNAEYKARRTEIESEIRKCEKKKTKFSKVRNDISFKIRTIKESIEFFSDNEKCPSCGQIMDETHKNEEIENKKAELKKLESGIEELNKTVEPILEKIQELNVDLEKVDKMKLQLSEINAEITNNKNRINKLKSQMRKTFGTDELKKAKADLAKARKEHKRAKEEKLVVEEDMTYLKAIHEMLKDTGIKTKIVREYIPLINNLVNQYLDSLGFYVKLELDENFNETIRSRHRDEFSYSSFSEGEKTKIDVALLFAWRQIAQMKNSLSTNLLILDETFDASLDVTGIENLMQLIRGIKHKTNVFVISHKSELLNEFDQTFEFRKVKNFSRYTIQ